MMMTQPTNSHNATHRQRCHPERGKESAHTAAELAHTIQAALARTTLLGTFIQTIETRVEVATLLSQDRYIDLVIPRRSNVLVCEIQ
jgi:glutamate-5-semialdehyde dehydrogenase